MKDSIFKSRLFLNLFLIPYGVWFLLTLIAMIPDETETNPLTWSDFLVGNALVLIMWFIISFVISLILIEIKKIITKPKTIDEMQLIDKNVIKLEQNKKKFSKKTSQFNNYQFIKNGMIILFILTIVSLFGASYTWSLTNVLNNVHGFNFTKTTWVFWCWLPIPILSIILGFKYNKKGYKCTKNIVAGFIIGFLLLIYGSFCLFPTFSQDYSKIGNYKNIIDAQLPTTGELEIQEWGTYFDKDKTEYTIINAYYDNEDTSKLVNSIKNSNNWILSTEIKSELKIFIPSTFYTDNDAYFSIYNQTLNEYNKVPNNVGKYEIYAMKYDIFNKQLEIHKFNYSYK